MKFAVFIDGANLYAASRALEFDIDYKKFLDWLGSRGQLVRVYYYTALLDAAEHNPIMKLVDWLDYNGFMVVTKEAKQYTDAAGRPKVKGNMDIEIAVDMLELAPYLDEVLLVSGDGDFRRLVEAVQRRGVKVTVASTIRSSPQLCADELRRQADAFLDIADLRKQVERAHDLKAAA